MDDILKAYTLKKKTLENYINVLWSNASKNRKLSSKTKSNYKVALQKFYDEQMKILDNERRRLILEMTATLSPPKPPPSKKACLVGINYKNTSYELRGCVNDVYTLRDLLVSQYGYKIEDIIVLIDEHATRENILKEFTSLVQQAKSGDSICFTFSGHGSYINDKTNEEVDGQDELLVSVDNFAITDDELKIILDTYLNPEVNFFSIFDSCHSGTVLDLKYAFDNNTTTITNESYKETKGNVILLSGCRDNQVSMDAYINNSFQGALSAAFVHTLRNNPNMTWNDLLTKMREVLLLNNFYQIPQISVGKSCNMTDLPIKI